MNPELAERWKRLERRARERGWTIDLLQADSGRREAPEGGQRPQRGEFALMELGGAERAMATGDLDSIEAFLQSGRPQFSARSTNP